jgi:hypothetical protein
LMGAERQPELQRRILENPYTHGKIKTLLAVEQQQGIGFVLRWVKTGASTNLDSLTAAMPAAMPVTSVVAAARVPVGLPTTLKLNGLSAIGTNQMAVINGASFAPGERKFIRLRNRTVVVICREIQAASVLLESNRIPITLKLEGK